MMIHSLFSFFMALSLFILVSSFSPLVPLASRTTTQRAAAAAAARPISFLLAKQKPPKISEKRRKQLGINPDEDEYDLSFALEQNTDPLITKLIAGSLILVLVGLLVVGVVLPSLTDYGENVCNPIRTGGRC